MLGFLTASYCLRTNNSSIINFRQQNVWASRGDSVVMCSPCPLASLELLRLSTDIRLNPSSGNATAHRTVAQQVSGDRHVPVGRTPPVFLWPRAQRGSVLVSESRVPRAGLAPARADTGTQGWESPRSWVHLGSSASRMPARLGSSMDSRSSEREVGFFCLSKGLMYFCTIKQLLESATVCLIIYQERTV